MTLETIASISQIIGNTTLVGGIIFGLAQLSEYRNQRRDAVAAELMRTFLSPDLADAMTIIRRLPDNASVEEFWQGGRETERAAVIVCTSFETMGLLVFRRIAPFPLVNELAGGIVVVMWRKLGPWLDHVRKEQSQPSWAEWFQWLAQQCERLKNTQVPAHVQQENWTP